tara:strand:- start:7227 stop:7853 length:627 start_codon:yes stop_codon:yes gene_type:complete
MQFQYLNQFLVIALAHFFAVISPGPDFALITRQSFLYGRKISIFTSLGIASGILVHIIYCIIGLSFLLNNNFLLFFLRIACSLYLCYLGIQSIFFGNINFKNSSNKNNVLMAVSPLIAFRDGFVTNILNIKATFFFLSLYVYIDVVPLYIKIFYGLWMSIITGLWFIVLSIILTSRSVKEKTYHYQFYINKLMGIVLIYLGIKIYLNF